MKEVAAKTKFFLAILLLASLNPESSGQVTVHLYDFVFINGGRVFLGDVAQLKGDPLTVDQLKSLQIGPVMKRTETRVVTQEEIRRAVPADVEIHLIGAPAVEIRRPPVGSEYCDILPAIRRRYEAAAGDSIIVSVESVDPKIGIDASGLTPVQYTILWDDLLSSGTRIISLERKDGNGLLSRMHCRIKVEMYARLAFPADHINRGQRIKPEDVMTRTVDLSNIGISNLVFNPDRLTGWEATRHLSPGSPIRWDQVCPPSAVRPGDVVELLIGSENFQIRTKATVLEPGPPGKKIWVRLDDSGKRLRAVVVDAGCVILE